DQVEVVELEGAVEGDTGGVGRRGIGGRVRGPVVGQARQRHHLVVLLALLERIGELPHGATSNQADYLPRMAEKQRPDRNLAMELVRVTEAAALAAARWMGRGDKNGADGAAVDAMRIVLE